VSQPSNAGLAEVIAQVDPLWRPFCDRISRADFWQLAAKTAIEESTPYIESRRGRLSVLEDGSLDVVANPKKDKDADGVQAVRRRLRRLLKGDALLEHFVLPFRWGRQDATNCTLLRDRQASGERGPAEIQRVLMTNLGLDVPEAVALMGAHTLGRCDMNNSGYNSTWKDRPDLFTTAYYKLLVVARWDRVAMTNPHTGERIYQWNINHKSSRDQNAMMLAADMQLIYGINPQEVPLAFGETCGPLATEEDLEAKMTKPRCMRTSSVYPTLNFDKYALEFAEGTTATQDEPGASKWLTVFARAFQKMGEAGYDQTALQCIKCPPPAHCPTCAEDVLCGNNSVAGSAAVAVVDSSATISHVGALALLIVLALALVLY